MTLGRIAIDQSGHVFLLVNHSDLLIFPPSLDERASCSFHIKVQIIHLEIVNILVCIVPNQ